MSNDKLKLSEAAQTEALKTQRASIEGESKVQVSKQQTAKEVVTLFKSALDCIKSNNEREATKSEWKGRVGVAEAAVRQASVELEIVLNKNQSRQEELRQSRQILDRFLALYDDTLRILNDADVSDDVKNECRTYLADLNKELVKLNR